MAPIKRVQPAFSPPRPKKSKTTTTPSTSNVSKRRSTNGAVGAKVSARKPNNRGRKRARVDPESKEDEDGEDNRGDRSALALVDMQAGEDDDDDEDEEEDEEDGEDSDEGDNPDDAALSVSDASEEPDMILAEITENNEPPPEALPEALVHKMLQHHFEKPEKTKLSSDARSLMTKYLEIFVREAIIRSSYERQQREHETDDEGGGDGGFLEVEDLERAAVQLCLDF